jgi:hypothetical protein
MSSSSVRAGSRAGRSMVLIFITTFILVSHAGCSRPGGSAGFEEKKVTVLDPRGQPSGIFGRRGEAGSHMMAIFDPRTQPTISQDELAPLRMAPRLDRLENKTIYLVNTGFEGSQEFFEEMQLWFRENMPAVNTVIHRKSGTMFSDSPELWVELKQKADGVVFGVGG